MNDEKHSPRVPEFLPHTGDTLFAYTPCANDRRIAAATKKRWARDKAKRAKRGRKR